MLEFFDVYSYLNDRSIDYSESGTNTSFGWVNIECPFPYCDDHSNHLGINLESKVFHCWKCGTKGGITKLIQELESCSYKQASRIVEEFQDIDSIASYSKSRKEATVPSRSNFIYPPKGCVKEFPEVHLQYLRSRDFDPSIIIPKYELMACHTAGDFKFRIIIPIIEDGEVVNFTTRTVIKDMEPRYKMASINKYNPITDIYDLLYNFDSVQERAFILEGPTDVWRMGDGSTCTFGTALSKPQILKLASLELAVLIFDSEAEEDARRLEYQIRPFTDTEIILLDPGLDPAQLRQDEVEELKREFSI